MLGALVTCIQHLVLNKVSGTRLCSVCLYCASAFIDMLMRFRSCDPCKQSDCYADSLHCSTQDPLCRKSFNARCCKAYQGTDIMQGMTSSINVVILHCNPLVHTISGEAKDRECNVS